VTHLPACIEPGVPNIIISFDNIWSFANFPIVLYDFMLIFLD